MMRIKHWVIAAVLPLLLLGKAVRAEDIRPAMEAANARWEAAFNTNAPAALATPVHGGRRGAAIGTPAGQRQ
jgi:hypothetical protein